MGELIPSNSSTPPPHFISPPSVPRAMPAREDCWSEDATFTLIEAWGQRYLDLNRGNLRQKQWQEVADTVNARHGHIKKARRTDVQCKNRIDTLKKKYKIEKARVLETNGGYKSPWPFFDPLDHLIGNLNAVVKKVSASPSQSPPLGVPIHHLARNNAAAALGGGGMNMMSMSMRTPVLPQKRPAVTPVQQQEEYFRRNYAAVAAAAAREEESEEEEAAAAEEEQEEEEDEEEGEGADEEPEDRDGDGDGDGIRKLARVIEKFGQVYARVEKEKQRQLIELEKQRMQFAKELECQRMQMLVEMQVQLEKIKRAKRSNSDDMYS